jgi:hypothetical protein
MATAMAARHHRVASKISKSTRGNVGDLPHRDQEHILGQTLAELAEEKALTEIMEEFDVDGDGELSNVELDLLRAKLDNSDRQIGIMLDDKNHLIQPSQVIEAAHAQANKELATRGNYIAGFKFLFSFVLYMAILLMQRNPRAAYLMENSLTRAIFDGDSGTLNDELEVVRQIDAEVLAPWVESFTARIFTDPKCGDGICESSPEEFPSGFGLYGCREDCGTYSNLTQVTFTFDHPSAGYEYWANTECMANPTADCPAQQSDCALSAVNQQLERWRRRHGFAFGEAKELYESYIYNICNEDNGQCLYDKYDSYGIGQTVIDNLGTYNTEATGFELDTATGSGKVTVGLYDGNWRLEVYTKKRNSGWVGGKGEWEESITRVGSRVGATITHSSGTSEAIIAPCCNKQCLFDLVTIMQAEVIAKTPPAEDWYYYYHELAVSSASHHFSTNECLKLDDSRRALPMFGDDAEAWAESSFANYLGSSMWASTPKSYVINVPGFQIPDPAVTPAKLWEIQRLVVSAFASVVTEIVSGPASSAASAAVQTDGWLPLPDAANEYDGDSSHHGLLVSGQGGTIRWGGFVAETKYGAYSGDQSCRGEGRGQEGAICVDDSDCEKDCTLTHHSGPGPIAAEWKRTCSKSGTSAPTTPAYYYYNEIPSASSSRTHSFSQLDFEIDFGSERSLRDAAHALLLSKTTRRLFSQQLRAKITKVVSDHNTQNPDRAVSVNSMPTVSPCCFLL